MIALVFIVSEWASGFNSTVAKPNRGALLMFLLVTSDVTWYEAMVSSSCVFPAHNSLHIRAESRCFRSVSNSKHPTDVSGDRSGCWSRRVYEMAHRKKKNTQCIVKGDELLVLKIWAWKMTPTFYQWTKIAACVMSWDLFQFEIPCLGLHPWIPTPPPQPLCHENITTSEVTA